MREIHVDQITDCIEQLFKSACREYPPEVVPALKQAAQAEDTKRAQRFLKLAVENADIAAQTGLPLCQDTGMAVVFAQIGQDVHITGGLFQDAVNQGVRRAYADMRKSVLSSLERINTMDNTPAVVHIELIAGEEIILSAAPKGFGSENMSALKMLKPSQGVEGVKRFIVETVKNAGGNPCPPVVVGVGIGGTMEKAALMAKHALLRPLGEEAEDKALADMEKELLEEINHLGIGPQGLGGRTTALAVHMESYPTHIAGLPVAVNMQCHCARHKTARI